jgi:cyclopropane fatty-acyl-phospholipid synthase-like methyltransferase
MATFNLEHKIDSYYTHHPVTAKILSLAKEGDTVLELGCGFGSTPLFNFFATERGIKVHTFESDLEWLSKFDNKYRSENHSFYHVDDWNILE